MSTTSYLLIKRLDTTVSDSFIHPEMQSQFSKIVNRCHITNRLSTGDFHTPPSPNLGLKPVAYNLLVDALTNQALFATLQDNSKKCKYWFYNIFIIPNLFDGLEIISNPELGIIKNITKGIEAIILSD